MSETMRTRMPTPQPESALLKKEAKRLLDGTRHSRKMRKSQITNLSGSALAREMKRLDIQDLSKGEAGIMRVQLLQALGLGIPTVKCWTKKSIVYMLEEVFECHNYEPENVKTKCAAIHFLQEFIARKCRGPPPPGPEPEAETTAPAYDILATKLREMGEENDALICDHADKFGERIDPDTLARLESLAQV